MEGDIARLKVPFENRFTGPVAIEIVSACQCFEIDWPRDTFQVGEKRVIDLTFFSANQVGEHTKTVDVILRNEDSRGYPIVLQFFVHVNVKLTALDETPEPPKTEKPFAEPVEKPAKKKQNAGRKAAKPVLKKGEKN